MRPVAATNGHWNLEMKMIKGERRKWQLIERFNGEWITNNAKYIKGGEEDINWEEDKKGGTDTSWRAAKKNEIWNDLNKEKGKASRN